MLVITIVLAVLLALVFAASGGQKALGVKSAVEGADHLGVSHGLHKMVGALEIIAAIGLLVGLAFWPLGVAAGVGLVLLMIGAVVTHIRASDKVALMAPAIVLGLLSAAEVIFRIASA